jgi:photosystem II stability/assembly factor-like uncharacterized protein
MKVRPVILRCLKTLLPVACAVHSHAQWLIQDSGNTAGLRGVHNVDGKVAWASGTGGTVLHTDDGGGHWQRCAVPPSAEKLDFRGVWAWSGQLAVVMSIGEGDQSRLYKTTDGCKTWTQLYVNPDGKGFWDAMLFFNERMGRILGDPVDGKFVVLLTQDGGEHWSQVKGSGPASDPKGEGAFAASNSALILTPPEGQDLQFGTGGLGGPRVVRAGGRFERPGSTRPGWWKSATVPLAGGTESTGVFSLGYRDQDHGVAVGGDYQKPNDRAGTAAFTSDGGQTWNAATELPSGFRSAVAWDEQHKAWISVGTNGADVSFDDGKTWQKFDGENNWNALSLPWAVGPKGKIGKLTDDAVKQR